MKKSFMTRALATGLSFAMAFSMAAVASTTTAFAASKPAMITYDGTSAKTLDVKLGETVKIKVNAATKSKYKVSAVKVSSSKLVAKKNTAGTVVAITGKKATEAGKPASVKVSFQVKKTKKASKYSYISKVNVLEEKTTMTAAATAVKEITLTFSKAVKDTAAAKIVVKKVNATPTFTSKWAEDAKSVVLTMDSKLTKGTYDVTVSGVEKEDLTASVAVEDQKLTAFELLSTNLVADTLPATFGTIKFKPVDQYGKFIKTNNVTITSSFGTLYEKTTDAAAAANSRINATSEPTSANFKLTQALAVIGSKGTITIVGENGVNLTSEITLVAPAQASKVENLGLYNTEKGKFMDMTAGDDASKYVIALKFTDQYGTELTAAEAQKHSITTTIAGGTTGVEAAKDASNKDKAPETVKIDGKDVYGVRLQGTAKAGTIQATVVNTQYGLLDNLSFTVAPGTVIKSFSASADNDIYVDEESTLSYTAIDADGNEVTKYDVLKKAFGSDKVTTNVTLKKQADGSAKLVYKMDKDDTAAPKNTSDYKAYTTNVLTFKLYGDSSNIIVYNTTVKVNQAREIYEVTGIDSAKVTATASKGAITLQPVDFKIADQYGNTMTKDQIKAAWADDSISIKPDGNNWTVTWKAEKGADKDINFTPDKDDAATAKFKVTAKDLGSHKDDGYTLELSKVDASKATDFAIEWKDGINTFNVSPSSLSLKKAEQFNVVGKVNGKKVTIPTTQYEIISGDYQGQNKDGSKDRITKTATLKVVVTDSDHKSNIIESEYTYSNADSKLTKIESGDNKVLATLGGKTIADFVQTADTKAAFKLKDQYGNLMKAPGDLTATISIIEGDGYINYDGTNRAIVVQDTANGKKAISEIVVTFTCGDLTKTETIKNK